MSTEIEVLARSEHWLAVNKPAALSVYESSYTGPREETVLGLMRGQLGVGRVHAIHRLDHATSGVLLLSLDARTAAVLSGQFESRAVAKRYIAVVRGGPEDAFDVDHPLAGADGKGAPKPASTRFRTLGRLVVPIALARHPEARYALVEALPETGRYHQIRRHLKHAAHPIVGDVKYGKGEHNRLFRQHFGVHRLLLHARGLQFTDPQTDAAINIEAPFDSAFTRALAMFGDAAAQA
jgi:tRNA pseudouridine65 synthase